MRYTNGCLRLMIYMVYIDFITSIIGVLNYTIIQNIGLSLVRYRIAWPPLLASGVSLPSHVNGPIFLYIYIYLYIYICDGRCTYRNIIRASCALTLANNALHSTSYTWSEAFLFYKKYIV